MGLNKTLLAAIIAMGGFDYYIDSVSGSDANNGRSPATAKQTLGSVTLTTGIKIGLARGSKWREQIGGFIALPDYVSIGAYGTGQMPLIDASDVSTGWTKTAGKTNVYQADLSVGASSQFLRLYENNVLLKWVADTTACDAAPGTYYCATTTGAATTTVYVNTSNSTNPGSNGKTYEHTARMFGIMSNTATGWSVTNVRTKRNLHTDGSLVLYTGGTARACIAEDGGKHSLWIGDGGLAEDCVAWKTDYTDRTGSTMFVSFVADGRGKTSTMRRCVAINSIAGQTVSGFYAHTQGTGFEWAEIKREDCSASGVMTGFDVNDCTLYTDTRSYTFNAANGVESAAIYAAVTDPYVKSGATTQGNGIHLRKAGLIDGLRMYSTYGSYDVYAEGGAGSVEVKNSVVYKTTGSGFFNLALGSADTLNSHNNIYQSTSGGGMLTHCLGDSQNNVFSPTIFFDLTGGSYANVAAYKAAKPLLDVASITSDPLLVDPANGNFGVSSGSPAIALGAGLLRPNVTYTAIPSDAAIAAM